MRRVDFARLMVHRDIWTERVVGVLGTATVSCSGGSVTQVLEAVVVALDESASGLGVDAGP